MNEILFVSAIHPVPLSRDIGPFSCSGKPNHVAYQAGRKELGDLGRALADCEIDVFARTAQPYLLASMITEASVPDT